VTTSSRVIACRQHLICSPVCWRLTRQICDGSFRVDRLYIFCLDLRAYMALKFTVDSSYLPKDPQSCKLGKHGKWVLIQRNVTGNKIRSNLRQPSRVIFIPYRTRLGPQVDSRGTLESTGTYIYFSSLTTTYCVLLKSFHSRN
jgi:hypothetical protein